MRNAYQPAAKATTQTIAASADLRLTNGGRARGRSAPRPREPEPWGVRGWAVVTLLSAAQLLLVGLAAASVDAGSRLIAVAALAPVPIVVGAAAASRLGGPRRGGRRGVLDELRTMASRVELAEAIVAHEQERMHELRTTVSSMSLSDRLLNDRRAGLSRATRRRLQRLRQSELARVERLLTDGPQDPVGPVDLAGVLDPLVDAARLRGHAVLWKGTPCSALGRADDITEIAHILLDNAARHARGHRIALEVSDRGKGVELRVSDDGPGVPPTLAPVVFERGTRGSTSGGQGIGLHIARRLARDNGGDLWLEPRPAGQGAVFVVRLRDLSGAVPCLATAG